MTPDFFCKVVGFESVDASGRFVYFGGSWSVLKLLWIPILRYPKLFVYFEFKNDLW
jgi:hypothetical protein